MQYKEKYDCADHWHAILIEQPTADKVASGEEKEILFARNTEYRGEVLIVSQNKGERGGRTICLADLQSVEKCGRKFRYTFANPRRVVEYPCRKIGVSGIVWDCYMGKGEIMEYPTHIDKDLIREKLSKSFNVNL